MSEQDSGHTVSKMVSKVTSKATSQAASETEPKMVRIRHPEKAKRPDTPHQRKPDWIRVKAPMSKGYHKTRHALHELGLTTVCEEAACPNIGECWSHGHATFMILGEICTRACAFCNVATGLPSAVDADEPNRIAQAVERLGLSHVVITSVDRDDLPDGGATHFAETIRAIRKKSSDVTIEILTPDFKGKSCALDIILADPPDVFNHNLETVPRLYPTIRPGARYFTSLALLAEVRERAPNIFTKSGLMVGLGESRAEIMQVMDDMRAATVDFITVGQYLQPTPKHVAVDRFMPPEEFASLASAARGKGFLMVACSPLTRSSYLAGDDFRKLQAARCSGTSAESQPASCAS